MLRGSVCVRLLVNCEGLQTYIKSFDAATERPNNSRKALFCRAAVQTQAQKYPLMHTSCVRPCVNLLQKTTPVVLFPPKLASRPATDTTHLLCRQRSQIAECGA